MAKAACFAEEKSSKADLLRARGFGDTFLTSTSLDAARQAAGGLELRCHP